MRIDFGKDGCSIVVVAETDSDKVALSAWLKSQVEAAIRAVEEFLESTLRSQT